MQRVTLRAGRTLAYIIAGILTVGTAHADKPEWAGGDKEGKHGQNDEHSSHHESRQDHDHGGRSSHDREGSRVRESEYFGERHRTVIRDYYAEQYHHGHCPPGLAKKHNGCMPPGQAKKWRIGRPLPRDVIYYDLPPRIVAELGAPPAGHRYVRVASDILLIAIGTGMIEDAIQDLGQR